MLAPIQSKTLFVGTIDMGGTQLEIYVSTVTGDDTLNFDANHVLVKVPRGVGAGIYVGVVRNVLLAGGANVVMEV